MVICNIVYDKKDDCLQKYLDLPFINAADKHWKVKRNIPTLIYGFKLAKELYPNEIDPHNNCIRTNGLLNWSYSIEEFENKCWLDSWITQSIEKHLRCVPNNIDVIFNKSFELKAFLEKIDPFPLVHAGKHEIYIAEKRDWDNACIIHSFQMDNLTYAGIDPETFYYELLNYFENRCVVLSTNDIDFTRIKNTPISFQDLSLASQNESIDIQKIIRTFSSFIPLSKEMVLTYFLKHDLYSKTLFHSFL